MTILDIITNPSIASAKSTLPNGSEFTIRPLIMSDEEKFGEFLSSLSPATNQLYQPHPLNKEAARYICKNLDYTTQLPFVVESSTGSIIAYFLFDFRYSEPEAIRYKKYGIALNPVKDCRFAPVVADAYQGQGIGKSAFKELLPILRQLSFRSLILSGGTQERNKRAITFYEKIGFKLMGEFEENNMRNYDMMLLL